MTYEAQLAAKAEVVREQFRRIAHMPEAPVEPMAGAADPWHYRNHLRFSTGHKFGDVGFVPRNGRGLLKVEDCAIAEPWANALLPKLQGKGRGLHQVQIRYCAATESHLIWPELPDLELPTGQKAYMERLAGRDFVVSGSAFFQVNSAQAEQMIRLIGEALPERGRLLADGFAGVGTFASIFAGRFDRVLAIEEAKSATRDAEQNVRDLDNVEVVTGKVETILPDLVNPPDAIILDPPRAGCFPAVLEAIVRFRPEVVVYVSCNPATLARDVLILVDGGYQLDRVTPIDMFPQTGHIECVTRLSLADGEPD
jgi:23S rRNA (uracil1939-C5)-methyltransferase